MLIALAALLGLIAGTAYTAWTRDHYLLMKADPEGGRTAMFVRGQFIYAVPESEYVQMRIAMLPKQSASSAALRAIIRRETEGRDA